MKLDVLIKNKNPNICGTGGQRVKQLFMLNILSLNPFSPNSSHLYSLQVENCDNNSRLVVVEYDHGKFRFEKVKTLPRPTASGV